MTDLPFSLQRNSSRAMMPFSLSKVTQTGMLGPSNWATDTVAVTLCPALRFISLYKEAEVSPLDIILSFDMIHFSDLTHRFQSIAKTADIPIEVTAHTSCQKQAQITLPPMSRTHEEASASVDYSQDHVEFQIDLLIAERYSAPSVLPRVVPLPRIRA